MKQVFVIGRSTLVRGGGPFFSFPISRKNNIRRPKCEETQQILVIAQFRAPMHLMNRNFCLGSQSTKIIDHICFSTTNRIVIPEIKA